MTLSPDTNDQASVNVRDDKSSIRLTNVEISTVHRIRAICFNFLVWKACASSGLPNRLRILQVTGFNMAASCLRLFREIFSRLTSSPLQRQQFSEPDRNLTAPVCRGSFLAANRNGALSRNRWRVKICL